ncbi:hypothetical protein Tco_0154555 [Tanacetum coccineum]
MNIKFRGGLLGLKRLQGFLEVTTTQGQKEWDKPFKAITEQELASLRAQANELFGNEKVWVKMPREIPIVDELEPQLLYNFLPLDVNLGDKRGTDPPINPYSPGSFRLKVIFDEKKPMSSWEFHVEDSWMTI